MKRRSIFRFLTCAAVASAMQLRCWSAPHKTPMGVPVSSDPIGICDIRSASAFKEHFKRTITNLKERLNPSEKYKIVWLNVYDATCNPYRSVGHFIAIPDKDGKLSSEAIGEISKSGFIQDFESKLHA